MGLAQKCCLMILAQETLLDVVLGRIKESLDVMASSEPQFCPAYFILFCYRCVSAYWLADKVNSPFQGLNLKISSIN